MIGHEVRKGYDGLDGPKVVAARVGIGYPQNFHNEITSLFGLTANIPSEAICR
jgi:hypothetical protein